jgi:hypothetical protein
MRTLVPTLALALLLPTAARAQHVSASASGVRANALAAPAGPSTLSARAVAVRDSGAVQSPLIIGAGILGGAAGFFGVGLASGYAAEASSCEGEYCALGWGLLGAAVGEALGVPLAMHWAAGQKEGLEISVLASLAIAAGGVALAVAWEEPYPLLVVPVAQIGAVLANIRAKERGRRRE